MSLFRDTFLEITVVAHAPAEQFEPLKKSDSLIFIEQNIYFGWTTFRDICISYETLFENLATCVTVKKKKKKLSNSSPTCCKMY